MLTVHKSVLLKETIDALNLKNGDIVVDATLGGGGHSIEILKNILPNGKLIAFDQDEKAIEEFKKKIEDDRFLKESENNIILINENFENIQEELKSLDIHKVNSITADLGVSSDQLDDQEIGLSFRSDSPLDMRLSRKGTLNAWKVLNFYSEEELKKIFQDFGDERYSGRIARVICEKRKKQKISSTKELVSIIEGSVPAVYKRGKIHFATKVFQALRIEVNKELDVLKKIVEDGINLLSENGRMAIITFHSGEDRIVKNLFREYARGCICPPTLPLCRCGKKEIVKIVTRKPIKPSEEEIVKNPRSRSAKLRIIEKN